MQDCWIRSTVGREPGLVNDSSANTEATLTYLSCHAGNASTHPIPPQIVACSSSFISYTPGRGASRAVIFYNAMQSCSTCGRRLLWAFNASWRVTSEKRLWMNYLYRIYANTTVDRKIISKFTFLGLDSWKFQEINFYC